MGIDVYAKTDNIGRVEAPDGTVLYDKKRDKIKWTDLLRELEEKGITLRDWYNARYGKDKK